VSDFFADIGKGVQGIINNKKIALGNATLLNPMMGALAMSLSSISVIGNALRLRSVKF